MRRETTEPVSQSYADGETVGSVLVPAIPW